MKITLQSVKKIWRKKADLLFKRSFNNSQGIAKGKVLHILRSLQINKNDVILDLGANIGDITALFTTTEARIYAFEPNPFAFYVLKQRFMNEDRVYCRPQAVSDQKGIKRLYLHENSEQDQVYWSTGSSLLANKGNVNRNKFVEVEAVDILDVLDEIQGRIKLVKMDVEGMEYRILKRLIDSTAIDKIDHLWVETHEQKIPELKTEAQEIKRRIQEKELLKIRMDWI